MNRQYENEKPSVLCILDSDLNPQLANQTAKIAIEYRDLMNFYFVKDKRTVSKYVKVESS